MKTQIVVIAWLTFLVFCFSFSQVFGDSLKSQLVPSDRLTSFVKCITDKGWVMYSSFTCSACRAQRKLFGPAADYLKIVECNPHAPDTQAQLCLKKGIRYTPTWLMEISDTEVKRYKGYKKLEELASMTGCTQ